MAQDRTAEIVAFDFDGTLTVEDSFTAFLKWRAGPWRYGLGCVRLIPAGVAYLFHRDRGRIKAAAVAVFLKGARRRDLEVEAQRFADLAWDRFMRPDALAAWMRWRRDGARLVIVTASPDLTVGPFARRLGADDLLGTVLAFDGEDRVTGAFAEPNCRGPEKVARLTEAFGPGLKLRAAYGDTGGDTEMLALAQEAGFRVFRG
ncbi:HAD-IB family hydrolase, partial [Phenylobacterium sp.]|uniref:HAD-IB family hydrolase n=1 Tax=Phenylobacterium sp. TaxID=1871053 RepID=UPI0039837F0A